MDTAGSAAVAREHVVPCRVAPEWVLLIPPRRSLGGVDVQAAFELGVAGPLLLAYLIELVVEEGGEVLIHPYDWPVGGWYLSLTHTWISQRQL